MKLVVDHGNAFTIRFSGANGSMTIEPAIWCYRFSDQYHNWDIGFIGSGVVLRNEHGHLKTLVDLNEAYLTRFSIIRDVETGGYLVLDQQPGGALVRRLRARQGYPLPSDPRDEAVYLHIWPPAGEDSVIASRGQVVDLFNDKTDSQRLRGILVQMMLGSGFLLRADKKVWSFTYRTAYLGGSAVVLEVMEQSLDCTKEVLEPPLARMLPTGGTVSLPGGE